MPNYSTGIHHQVVNMKKLFLSSREHKDNDVYRGGFGCRGFWRDGWRTRSGTLAVPPKDAGAENARFHGNGAAAAPIPFWPDGARPPWVLPRQPERDMPPPPLP